MKTRLSIRTLGLGMLLAVALQAQSATTDLAETPLVTSPTASVLPNVFFMLDDSGSMGWDYMPDDANDFGSGTHGAASSQCNGVYYDPTLVYIPPVDSTGVSYANSSFTAAWTNGYNTGAGTTNLSTSFVDTGGDPAQAAFYYTYSGAQTTAKLRNYYDTSSTFYTECNSLAGSSATITIGGSGSTRVNSITVSGTTITSGATSSETSTSTLASRTRDAITLAGYTASRSGSVVTIRGSTADVGISPIVTPSPATGSMTFGTTPFTASGAASLFTKVIVKSSVTSYAKASTRTDCAAATCTFAEESQNFANWYSYYRTRMLTMKTAAGHAFKTVGNNFRVGFASMNNNTSSDYLGLDQFTPANKASWYAKLYATTTGNSTPLREALSKVGNMYADKLATFNGVSVVDPVQYSCQQNFTLLTTDGFWNGNAGYKLGGTAVGNQDGNEVRPMYDGAIQQKTTTRITQTQTQRTQSTSQEQSWTQQLQSQTSSLQRRTGTLQWSTTQQKTEAPLQWQSTLQQTTAPLQWQTNLQKTGGTLAMWTDQMEVKAPLLWSTNLQKATAALQWQTNLQATTGTLQKRTSQLQKQITQLQGQTSQLQQQISQLQSSTSNLQSSTMYLQTSTSSNSGSSWGVWSDTASCTWDTSGGSRRRCQYAIAPAATSTTVWSAGVATWANAASCTSAFSTVMTGGTTWSNNGTSCRYTAWTAPINATSCTAVAQDATSPHTVGTARQCSTVVSSPYANVASCTTVSTPDGSGQTTQCQYTAWTGWAGTSTCTALAQSGASPYSVGTATQCQSPVTTAWANAAATCTVTTVPDASGFTTQCRYFDILNGNGVGAFSNWSNAGSSTTCTTAAQTAASPYTQLVAKECQLTAVATNYVTLASGPSCSVSYNNPGTSTSDASGKAVQACTTAGFSAPANVGANGSCTQSANVLCSMVAATPAYVTTNPPTCTTSYTPGVSGTADGSGNVSVCSTAGFNTPAAVSAGGTCATGANVTCSTGTDLPASYVTNYPVPSCTPTYNAGGSSTADASGYVVTGCPTDGSFGPSAKLSPAIPVGPNGTCDWSAPHAGNMHMWCDLDATTAATTYVTTFPPTCSTYSTVWNGSYWEVTADASGNISWACATSLVNTGTDTYSPAQTVPSNATCTGGAIATGVGGGSVQCVTGTPNTPTYVTSYPPSCATTYNGTTGTSTAVGTTVVTACTTAGTPSPAINIGANGTCDTALSNVLCSTAGGTTSSVTTYPPTCTVNPMTGVITADASGKVVTACPTAGTPTWTNATGACTIGGTVNCQYAWGGWSNTASCTTNFDASSPYTITSGTDCRYDTFTAWADLAATSCTTVAPSAGSPYVVATARNCKVVNVTTPADTPAWPSTAYVPVSSCTSTGGTFNASGRDISCQTVTSGPTPVAACTATGPTALNSWTTTTCANNTLMNAQGVASCTAGTDASFIVTTCNTTTVGPVNLQGCIPDATATAFNNWTTTACSFVSGGTADTLADVAEYYYVTDLRTTALGNQLSGAPGVVNGTNITTNNVPSSGLDSATHQHMTTFTLGLGARGKMVFDPSYQSATSGDFYSVKEGSTANTATGVCSWQATNSICDWPIPGSDKPENIDDLWHAAVNGRGTYFSAANPSDLSIALTSALAGVSARLGSSAAATTSTAFITEGDNFLFRSSFVSLQWTGELSRQQLDVNTGAVLPTIDWSAQSRLDTNTTRTIYTFDPTNSYNGGGSNKLKLFTYANLTGTQQTHFALSNLLTLSQFCSIGSTCLSAGDQALAAGTNLVNFIAGNRTHEGALADNTKYYRQRLHVLGDIVDSESVYIKTPPASFSDPGYATFKNSAAITGRDAMVYVGANDGMLHAFRASDDPATTTVDEGGTEAWAYIPSIVIPDLYKLANKGYDLNHHFYVDGTPVPADICVSNCSSTSLAIWKTILVSGLNGGGEGYFALDVTDPANPKALWEFTNTNMGFSYGNPKIVKLKDNTWVAMVTSGYNNTTGDGRGHLYILDAYTGALIRDISTGVGTPASPSGLARIDVPVATPGVDATGLAVYGGDLEGNLWRFDINNDIGAAGYDAQLLATLRDGSGNVQPITSKPLVTLVTNTIVVNVGTGRYLGASDQTDTSQQSFYAIKDTFSTTSTPSSAIFGNPRTEGTFIQQTQTTTTCPVNTSATICTAGQSVVISSNNAVNFSSNGGWYVDFPQTGERNNTDPAIIKGTLLIATNLPSSSSCSIGGDSFLYQLDYRSGGSVSTSLSAVVGKKLGNELTSRPVVAMLEDGTSRSYTQGSGGQQPQVSVVWDNSTTDGIPRRVSWRELIGQ